MSDWGNETAAAEQPENGDTAQMKSPQEMGWAAPTSIDYAAATSTEPVQPILLTERKYEYAGDEGDLGPEVPELEQQLFNAKFRVQAGDQIENLMTYQVTFEGPTRVNPIYSFKCVGLHPVMEKIVDLVGYSKPTPIQQYTIPAVTHGCDVIAVAQTGSGKTAAYLIPILSRLMGKAKKWCAPRPNPLTYNPATDAIRAEPLVLILCPTRELAIQIFDETRRFCYRSMLRPCVVYGGSPRRAQLEDLRRGCDILIGTPGRLKDIVENDARWLSLSRLKYTILDEADEMIQPDWEEEMKSILGGAASNLNDDHHFMMFSATFNKEARAMAAKYMEDDHIRIRVGRTGSVHSNVVQDVFWVDEDKKMQALYDLLSSMAPCRTLIFCNANGKCDTIDDFLYNHKFPVTSIHSKRTQYEREDAIRSFKIGQCPIMVTSNVTGRGLDVKNVMIVINYDLPSSQYGGIQEYVHRIGRTARIGNMGQATSFYNDRNEDIAQDLTNVLLETGQQIPEFLQQYVGESGKAEFDDDKSETEEEAAAGAPAASGGWGEPAADDSWGNGGAAQGNGSSGWDDGAAGGNESWDSNQATTSNDNSAW